MNGMKWLIALVAIAEMAPAVPAIEPERIPEEFKRAVATTESFGTDGYPTSFWNYAFLWLDDNFAAFDENAVKEWADSGITVAQLPRFDCDDPRQVAKVQELLELCDKYGMKAIVMDDRRAGMPAGILNGSDSWDAYRARLKEAYADFGSFPAFFGFHVGDEPQAAMKDLFFDTMRIQKEALPQTHPYGNLLPYWEGMDKAAGAESWPAYLDEYAKEGRPDVVSYDCYTQMAYGGPNEGWDAYFDNLRLHREAMGRSGIPFWTSLLSVGHYHYRTPSRDELRWQFHTAIAAGAKGVVWFFYYHPYPETNYQMSPYDDFFRKTATYDSIRDIQARFQRRYGKIINRLYPTRVTFHNTKPWGNGEMFTPDGLVAEITGGPVMLGEFVDPEGARYVMLVNLQTSGANNVNVTFTGKDARLFSYDWGGNEYEGQAYSAHSAPHDRNDKGITIGHYLMPGQEAIYKVVSESAAAEPVVYPAKTE